MIFIKNIDDGGFVFRIKQKQYLKGKAVKKAIKYIYDANPFYVH